jgi:chromosome segregation protein
VKLQKLQLRGFKTFADKTEMEFGPGITAVVGPNGAGKSNITDSILWVLGEQSQRAVRSHRWEDVIFAGTEQRSPLGLAEVSLTIDNSDGELPVDYSEVVIARRFYRSGESEYLLNGTRVRLRDIQDLLMDTGLTPGGYAVIGQGDIDAVLSARPEDRRELIEQAAAVRKYQIRRAQTERNLERTLANLARVNDIVYELSKQREPLEKQAEVARSYQGLADDLKRIELSLLVLDWDRRQEKRGQTVHEMENLKGSVEYNRTRLRELELERERLRQQMTEVEERLEQERQALTQAERKLDLAEHDLTQARAEYQALAQRQERLQPALTSVKQRRAELEEQAQELVREQAEIEEEIARLAPEVEQREHDLRVATEEQARLQAQLATLERRRAELQKELAVAQREAEGMASLHEDLGERITRLSTQREQLEERRGRLQGQMEGLREEVKRAREEAASCRDQWREAREQQNQTQKSLREQRAKKDHLTSYLSGLESRARVLQELAETREGFAEGPREIMRAARAQKLEGIRGLLGEMLEVPRRLEVAVEAGLGDLLQWVLVEDEASAQAAAEYLRQHELGRATFLPVDRTGAGWRRPDAYAVSQGAGVHGSLKKLVRYPRALAQIFEPLLEQVVVVDSLEVARTLRTGLRAPVSLVTLDGQILGMHGELTVGGGDTGLQASFQRRQELQELLERLTVIRGQVAEMWAVEEELERAQAEASTSAAGLEQQANARESEAQAGEGQMRGLADSLRAAHAAVEEMEQEIGLLKERLQQTAERGSQAQITLQGLEVELAGSGAEEKELSGHQLEEEKLERSRQELEAVRIALAEARERERSLAHLRSQTEAEAQRAGGDEERLQQELQEIEERIRDLPGQTEFQEAGLVELRAEAEAAREQVTGSSQHLAELRHSDQELEGSRREIEELGEGQREELYRAELNLARAEASMENLEMQLREVYSLSVDEAREAKPEDFKEPQARREANQLRSEIRALGPVNLSSIEEVERLGAREQYLRNQAQDLEQAREDLLQVIAEVDEAATAAFLTALAEVGEAFQELFEHFFPGGVTSLELTDPEHPLASGIDVMVRLPGKRRQNLLLLSGGERAMTAVALLFALLKVRPSPFCVMDEIDAAIDASNTEKLVEIIQDFSEHSQFIIITHNPRTMEAAGVLYGVTMRQRGVSRLISVTLEEAQQEAREHEASAGGGASSRALPVT